MSIEKQPEITQDNIGAEEVNAPSAPGPSLPEGEASSAVAKFRQGFFTDARCGLLLALGEEPKDYQQMMESLIEDLQPRRGLETQLVEQMGETLWRMGRAQRMRDGLALKSIQRKLAGEEMTATTQASQALELLEPFERLQEALSRRGQGPTAAEIEAFAASRKGDLSEEMQEFILLLKSLTGPMEEGERKATRHRARSQLRPMMEPYENVAWQFSRRAEKVQSSANLAALMAPEDQKAVLLQRMEDSSLRRLWRLTSTLAKVRQGVLQKKDVKKSRTKPECA